MPHLACRRGHQERVEQHMHVRQHHGQQEGDGNEGEDDDVGPLKHLGCEGAGRVGDKLWLEEPWRRALENSLQALRSMRLVLYAPHAPKHPLTADKEQRPQRGDDAAKDVRQQCSRVDHVQLRGGARAMAHKGSSIRGLRQAYWVRGEVLVCAQCWHSRALCFLAVLHPQQCWPRSAKAGPTQSAGGGWAAGTGAAGVGGTDCEASRRVRVGEGQRGGGGSRARVTCSTSEVALVTTSVSPISLPAHRMRTYAVSGRPRARLTLGLGKGA